MSSEKDVFICHASEDKETVVRPLRDAFVQANITCWLDEDEIIWGDDIAKQINNGLAHSKYVVVILSKVTLDKSWQQFELLAALNKQAITGEVILCPLLVGSDSEVAAILKQYPVLEGKSYLRWSSGADSIVKAMTARLSRREIAIADASKSPRQSALLESFGAVVLAAGKSSRMGDDRSKMLIHVPYRGQQQPMLFYTIDIFVSANIPVLILVGYDGDSVRQEVVQRYRDNTVSCLAVSLPDGSDLGPNTGSTLKKFSKKILEHLRDAQNLLFCVGDQPYMRRDTIVDFLHDYAERCATAGLLAADSRNTPLEDSASTRIIKVGGTISFDTPPKGITDFGRYSPLLDVGVLVIKRELFKPAISKIQAAEVFSKLLNHIPGNPGIFMKTDRDPYQFLNINEYGNLHPVKRIEDEKTTVIPVQQPDSSELRSRILLDWLEWNVERKRNVERNDVPRFSLPSYANHLHLVGEVDTTLICSGTRGCARNCTYRSKHRALYLKPRLAGNALRQAKELGYKGVLFSGGGENLEEKARDNFLTILKYAKRELGMETNLATNGLYINPDTAMDLARLLDTIRFSVPATSNGYCHGGIVAPNIVMFKRTVDHVKQQKPDYVPTKIYANVLMSPTMKTDELEAILRMYSQIGLDAIRLKPMHEWIGDSFEVRPEKYEGLVAAVERVQQDEGIRLPRIEIAKIPGMLEKDQFSDVKPEACWYRDFNPLVLGCNGHIYACCEMKYEENGFDCGSVSLSVDNLRELLSPKSKPQPIVPKKCFTGCKGYLINRDLQCLLNGYIQERTKLFDQDRFAKIRDRVLQNIPRDVLAN